MKRSKKVTFYPYCKQPTKRMKRVSKVIARVRQLALLF